jgi:hypothetical protein
MFTFKTIKTTMIWQQRQVNVVRFERHENDTKALVFGETLA